MAVYELSYMNEELVVPYEIDEPLINECINEIRNNNPYNFHIYLDIDNYICIQADDFYTIDPEDYILQEV